MHVRARVYACACMRVRARARKRARVHVCFCACCNMQILTLAYLLSSVIFIYLDYAAFGPTLHDACDISIN